MSTLNSSNIILPVTLVERSLDREGDIYPGSLGFVYNIRILNTRIIEYKLLFVRFGRSGRDRLTKRALRFSPTDTEPPFRAVDTLHKNSLLMGDNIFSGFVVSYCLFITSFNRDFSHRCNVLALLNRFDNLGSEYNSIVWTTEKKLTAIKIIRQSEVELSRAITTMVGTLNANFGKQ